MTESSSLRVTGGAAKGRSDRTHGHGERERRWRAGRDTELRRSPRRRTLASVRVLEGPELEPDAVVTDLSVDGARICTANRLPVDSRLRLALDLPSYDKPVCVSARVVRVDERGLAVRFVEMAARDRSRLRSYTGYYQLDEAMVRVQRALGDLVPAQLQPRTDPEEVRRVLDRVCAEGDSIRVVVPGRGFSVYRATLLSREASGVLEVEVPDLPRRQPPRLVYVAFTCGALCYAFEGLVRSASDTLHLEIPERLYVSERRARERSPATEQAWCEIGAPHLDPPVLRLPIIDTSASGASLKIEDPRSFFPGLRLPPFDIVIGQRREHVAGATVRYVTRDARGNWRAGIRLVELEQDRAEEREGQRQERSRTLAGPRRWRALWRMLQWSAGRVLSWWRGESALLGEVEVVRYRNKDGKQVVGIIDANFDTSDPSIRPDVAIVLSPAFLKRKEVFGLFARTLVDDLSTIDKRVVVLRFDACGVVGESDMDPELVARGTPYLYWSVGDIAPDMEASFAYLDRRFRPAHRVLVSVSLSAIGARKLLRERGNGWIDLWVAPYGCPDTQDMMRNYLAGLDLFGPYERGEVTEPLLIHGRPAHPDTVYGKAIRDGLAYPETAQEDVARFVFPIVWILGAYDYWVTVPRVRAMLERGPGAEREIFEVPTGHVLKDGREAIEMFKLVSESVSKHVFGIERCAVDPNMRRFARQHAAEWARVKRLRLTDEKAFWHRHLFGDEQGEVGYDILLEHPEYGTFNARQVELLDVRPGHSVVDLGCGTGNVAAAIVEGYRDDGAPAELALVDLVPEAVERSERKVRQACVRLNRPLPRLEPIVLDLEVSRLLPVAQFLDGQLYGVEALYGRVEGLERRVVEAVARRYGPELHRILRGEPADVDRVRALCAELDRDGAEAVLELGRAARFLRGEVLADDLRPGVQRAETTADLRFRVLEFGKSSRELQIPLPSERFDRAISSLVISYLFDPAATLCEFRRILKPGGKLVVSSLRRDFDLSKLYHEEAVLLRNQLKGAEPAEREKLERKIEALRRFASLVGQLVELEEEGRFKFYTREALADLLAAAGFVDIHVFEAFGAPPVAYIAVATKR